MKRLLYMLMLLLVLTACGNQRAIPAEPYSLEIEYGDSGVMAEQGTFSWVWEGGKTEYKAEEPLTRLSDIPFVNESKDKNLKLLFAAEPDGLELRYWSSADGYKTAVSVEKPKTKLTVPKDRASYLYEVKAKWEDPDAPGLGGSCTYYFRYLPEHATGDQTQEISLYRTVQLEPEELFGASFFNNLDAEQKTCTNEKDLTAILMYLKENLTTNFVQIPAPEEEADYVLRLAVIDGSQLTLSYGGEGKNAWIMLNGVPYEAEVMDLYTLWKSLETDSVSLEENADGQYLQISEEFPGAAWGEVFAYGYLRSLDTQVLYDEILWVEDAEQPNGYDLQHGTLGIQMPLAEQCEYWLLKEHAQPWCQVEQDVLWQWAETTGWDVLFRLYTKNGEIVAICEQYVP